MVSLKIVTIRTQEYQATLKILEAKRVRLSWNFLVMYIVQKSTSLSLSLQSENTELESQVKWLKRESEEAKAASEIHIKEVLSIAEDLKTKEAEQASTIEQLKRSARENL